MCWTYLSTSLILIIACKDRVFQFSFREALIYLIFLFKFPARTNLAWFYTRTFTSEMSLCLYHNEIYAKNYIAVFLNV